MDETHPLPELFELLFDPTTAETARRAAAFDDHLIPRNLDGDLWKSLGLMEGFYLTGLEVESHAEYCSGVYQFVATFLKT